MRSLLLAMSLALIVAAVATLVVVAAVTTGIVWVADWLRRRRAG